MEKSKVEKNLKKSKRELGEIEKLAIEVIMECGKDIKVEY